MNFQETINYLYGLLPMYQRVGQAAYKKDLTNTVSLLKALDDPHRKFKSVHIAGTNGKGTSAHGIAAILQTANYKTGLYTSPHLKNFTERIKINGVEIAEDFVMTFVDRVKGVIDQVRPSFFELTVAMAFDYFAAQKVDIAVVETGLGGRLDSTNVVNPEVSLITNIGLDHTDMLGETLPEIAREKAGIIKQGVPVVIGTHQQEVEEVFYRVSREKNAELVYAEKLFQTPPLPDYFPYYFKRNVPGMLGVIHELVKKGFKITQDQIGKGLMGVNKLTKLKGRFQFLMESPLTIADVSHNYDGLKVLLEQVKGLVKGHLHIVFGSVKGKDVDSILTLFPKDASYCWSESRVPRSMGADVLMQLGEQQGLKGQLVKEVNEAIERVSSGAHPDDLILITGSTFLISEIAGL